MQSTYHAFEKCMQHGHRRKYEVHMYMTMFTEIEEN